MVDVKSQNNEQHQKISGLLTTRKAGEGCQMKYIKFGRQQFKWAYENVCEEVRYNSLQREGKDSNDSSKSTFILFYITQPEEETEWISLTLGPKRGMDIAEYEMSAFCHSLFDNPPYLYIQSMRQIFPQFKHTFTNGGKVCFTGEERQTNLIAVSSIIKYY